jgi:Leucine Rich repeat
MAVVSGFLCPTECLVASGRDKIMERRLLAMALTLSLTMALMGGPGRSAEPTLRFVDNANVGKLLLPPNNWSPAEGAMNGRFYHDARGAVPLSSGGRPLLLVANDTVCEHLNLFRDLPANAFWAIDFSGCGLRGSDLALLSGLKGLRRLDLQDTEISDEGLENLQSLSSLESLCLASCGLNGSTLHTLRGLKKLRRLDFSSDHLGSQVYPVLEQFPLLSWLILSHSAVKDQNLLYLGKLKNLYELCLAHNLDVTDSGIKHLSDCRSLRRLDVNDTAVTVEGLLALQHLPLQWLCIGDKLGSPANLKRLHAAFPKAAIVLPKKRTNLPAEIFAPLH